MQPLGFHVSISGGLHRAIGRALKRECTCLQIFCGNPRGWTHTPRSGADIEKFRDQRNEAQLSPVVVHACYLINPCSPDDAVYEKSIQRLRAELETSARIGADYYVIHPGSSKGQSDTWAMERSTQCFIEALAEATQFPALLLENTAGTYGPGRSFAMMAEMGRTIEDAMPDAEVGLVMDSCHAFAAGYDIRQKPHLDQMAREIENTRGLHNLNLLHLNDSVGEVGRHLDRHTHIGEGNIGIKGFQQLLSHDAFAGLPAVLETPWESVQTDIDNIQKIRRIIADTSTID